MPAEKVKKLTELLKRAEKEDPNRIKAEAKEFLRDISQDDLIMAEQEMVNDGVRPEELRHLCAAHIELMQEELSKTELDLPETHPIRTLVAEHDEILHFLDELEVVNRSIQRSGAHNSLNDLDIEKLRHIAHHLEAAEKHHQREEEVLFPAIEEHGVFGPPEIMRSEHITIRAVKKSLNQLANGEIENNFDKFKDKLKELSEYLIFNLRDHIFKENNILYPAALEVIVGDEKWAKIKKEADLIGYCCFTPKGVI